MPASYKTLKPKIMQNSLVPNYGEFLCMLLVGNNICAVEWSCCDTFAPPVVN